MSTPASLPPDVVLRSYFHAKDENRPHLLDRVLCEDAVLEVRNSTSSIVFPAVTTGREAIASVLVRSFGQTYENVYSLHLARPDGQTSLFECGWLVAMTAKTSGNVRLGCGRYTWEFAAASPNLARRLVITIDEMQVLQPSFAPGVFDALAEFVYPWCSLAQVTEASSRHAVLRPTVQRMRTD
jgi:hypothetical protein